MMDSAFDLLLCLKKNGWDRSDRDPWWWPESGSFEVVVGSLLTQNTSWSNVEKSLNNLRQKDMLSPDRLSICKITDLELMIRPSGFYSNKARNLIALCRAMTERFGTFERFRNECSREWLLERRGIGDETADSILNYACRREAFVVDRYTARLLNEFGYEFDDYSALQEWVVQGIAGRERAIYPELDAVAQIYARSHGMIVEYCKIHRKKNGIDISDLRSCFE